MNECSVQCHCGIFYCSRNLIDFPDEVVFNRKSIVLQVCVNTSDLYENVFQFHYRSIKMEIVNRETSVEKGKAKAVSGLRGVTIFCSGII